MTLRITCVPGHGIGPEVIAKVIYRAFAEKLDVEFDIIEDILDSDGNLSKELIDSMMTNKIMLKGPTETAIGGGRASINVELRNRFNTYASIRPVKSDRFWPALHPNVDLVIFREATEDLYTGEEYWEGPDTARSVKTITRQACTKIITAAFDYAVKHGRNKVTCVTKANIMKLSDGLMRDVFLEIARDFPNIKSEHMLVDNCACKMVMEPSQFDVIVTSNLYGDILSDLGAGLVGGLGVAPGALIGEEFAIFEAVHGTAPDIVGKNLANPTALWKSFEMLLEYVKNRP